MAAAISDWWDEIFMSASGFCNPNSSSGGTSTYVVLGDHPSPAVPTLPSREGVQPLTALMSIPRPSLPPKGPDWRQDTFSSPSAAPTVFFTRASSADDVLQRPAVDAFGRTHSDDDAVKSRATRDGSNSPDRTALSRPAVVTFGRTLSADDVVMSRGTRDRSKRREVVIFRVQSGGHDNRNSGSLNDTATKKQTVDTTPPKSRAAIIAEVQKRSAKFLKSSGNAGQDEKAAERVIAAVGCDFAQNAAKASKALKTIGFNLSTEIHYTDEQIKKSLEFKDF